jgi:hypothetical protein
MLDVLRAQEASSAESAWSVLQSADGRYIIRRNDSALPLAGSPDYKTRVLVRVTFQTPTENGMPQPAESEELYDVEDTTSARFEADGFAVLVLSVVGNNMKEMIFYARDGDRPKQLLAELRTQITSHKIQHNIADDPAWGTYRKFVR